MNRPIRLAFLSLAALLPMVAGVSAAPLGATAYRWARRRSGYEPLEHRIAVPSGFQRVVVAPASYAAWLRGLPLLPAGTPVRSYRGRLILAADHPALAAVVDLDVGRRDRQQCVDTIMRLRGEYLYARGRGDAVRFAWAGGRRYGFRAWRQGLRPVRRGRSWVFEARAGKTRGYESFRRYLGYMFSWTGTIHQGRERRVKLSEIQAGDFFLYAGSPGHAVVVLDLARDAKGRRVMLLGQGYMPAQDLHVLRGTGPTAPWFLLGPKGSLRTPLWPRAFEHTELRRFRD